MHNQIKCAIIPHAFGLGGTLYLPLLISFPFYSNANYGSEARPIYTGLSAGEGRKAGCGIFTTPLASCRSDDSLFRFPCPLRSVQRDSDGNNAMKNTASTHTHTQSYTAGKGGSRARLGNSCGSRKMFHTNYTHTHILTDTHALAELRYGWIR